MAPSQRARLIDCLAEILHTDPTCPDCDPSGGCADHLACRREQAEIVLDLIERETT